VETVSKTSFTQQPSRSKQSLGRVLQNRFKGLMHKLRKKRRVKPQEKASVAPQKNSSSPFVLDSLPPPPPNRVWREGFLGSKNPVRSLLRSTLIQVDRARELVK